MFDFTSKEVVLPASFPKAMLFFVTERFAGAAAWVIMIDWLPNPATVTVTTAVRGLADGFASAVRVKELFSVPDVGLTLSHC